MSVQVGLKLRRAGRAFVLGCSINIHNKQEKNSINDKSQSLRFLSHFEVTKNLELISAKKISQPVSKLKINLEHEKPLVVILQWLLAKRKDIFKYANFYVDQGFDVLNVSSTPWQLLWPAKGTQLIANDLVSFLDKNIMYQPLVLHGFSIGAYQWGEVLVRLAQDQVRFQHIIDRIVAQVWDSGVDITEFVTGFPVAVFPANPVLQTAFRKYLMYHLKAFNSVATVHYVRSSQMFHTNLVRAPALFLVSKTDPVGTETANTRVKDSWESLGTKITWKCWDASPHVSHYYYHKQEYISLLCKHLSNLDLIPYPEKISINK